MLLTLLACRHPEESPTPDLGVLRLGPPAPSVGAYGIAAPPGSGRVYVSNLHVPFLTVADATTGAWIEAIDLRDGCAEKAFFPRLYLTGNVLWVTDLTDGRLCRYDLADEAWLPTVEVGPYGGVTAFGDDLWVATDGAIQRHDGTGFVETLPVDGWASALDVDGDAIALLFGPEERVSIHERDGTLRWGADVRGAELEDIALLDGKAYVTERRDGVVIALADGAEAGRLATGSDAFSIEAIDGTLYVANRQGAALPESGAYEGDPALVTALDADLGVRWRVEIDKTVHFLAWDGRWLWTANEDALRLSAIDPIAGVEALRGEPIGLTLDHIAVEDGRFYLGSHLTDELWRADFAGTADAVDVCGWPFLAVPTDAGLVVPCEESGDVWTVDPDSLEVVAHDDVADTFFPACPGGLCTGHDLLVGAAADGDAVAYTDGQLGAVRWTDGRVVDLGEFPEPGALHHFDVVSLNGGIVAYEPRSEMLYRVENGAVVATLPITEESALFPFVPEEDHVWVGATAYDSALAEVARLDGNVAQTAGEGWLVTTEGKELVVWRDQEERGRLALTDLRVPPWPALDGGLGPMRYRVHGGELVVANVMRGTLERRALPGLGPLGDDTPLPVGRWAEWEGLR